MKDGLEGKALPLEPEKPPGTTSPSFVNSRRTKLLGTLVLVVAGAAYMGYRLATAPQWQQFHAERFWRSLVQVRLSYLLLAAAFVFASHYFRSLRWQVFLRPMKRARLRNIFTSTLIGFSAVALAGRPGEVVRPLLIARKEQLGIPSQLAAWALERVFDSLTVGGLLGATLIFFPPEPISREGAVPWISHLEVAGIVLLAGALGVVGFLGLLRYRQLFSFRVLTWLLRPLPQRYRNWIRTLIQNFSAGLGGLDSVASLLACSFFSMLVWGTLLVTYWSVLQALGSPLEHLNLAAIILVLAAGAVGSLAHLPAVGGGTQVATVLSLTELFAVPLDIASSAAILLWALTFMMVLIPGLPLAAHEGLSWQRLRSLTRTEITQQQL